MRNEKIFKIFFEFVNNKNKEVLKQKFYNYSREIAVENIKKTTKLRQAKLTFKKKLLYFFYVIYIFEKIALKAKLLRLHHNNFLANYFEFKKIRVLM